MTVDILTNTKNIETIMKQNPTKTIMLTLKLIDEAITTIKYEERVPEDAAS